MANRIQPNVPTPEEIFVAHAVHAQRNGLSNKEAARQFSNFLDPSETEEEFEATYATTKPVTAAAVANMDRLASMTEAERNADTDAAIAEIERRHGTRVDPWVREFFLAAFDPAKAAAVLGVAGTTQEGA